MVAKWNEKDLDVDRGMQFHDFIEDGVEKPCHGCSRMSGRTSVQDYTDKTFALDG